MSIRVIQFETTSTDKDGWVDVTTYFATQRDDSYTPPGNGGENHLYGGGWNIGESNLTVYPDEVDAYIELLQKIKAENEGKPDEATRKGLQ